MNGDEGNIATGQRSDLDYVLYGIKATSAAGVSIVGDIDLAATNAGTDGKQRTNLPTNNQIPENWKYFLVKYIGFKFLSLQLLADFFTATNDAFYVLKIGDTDIKQGHLSELVFPSAFYGYYLSTVVTSGAPGVGAWASDYRVNGFVPLMEPIKLPAKVNFNFVVTFKTDVTSLRNTLIGAYWKGVLAKKIIG